MPLLYDNGEHKVYYFRNLTPKGIVQTNQYVIVDGDEGLIVDPGGRILFKGFLSESGRVISVKRIKGIFLSHQDPDVLGSLASWLLVNPNLKVYMPKIWTRFLPHLFSEKKDLDFVVELPDTGGEIELGKCKLTVIPAHFLHSAGNFSFYDSVSVANILFSGDIGASFMPPEGDYDFVLDFSKHVKYMENFHRRYMASNKVCRKWVSMVKELDIDIIAPQHGALFKGQKVIEDFLKWLESLECGIDLL